VADEASKVVAVEDVEAELKVLSDKAEGGDHAARAELRRRVEACSPQVIAQLAQIAVRADRMLVKTISGGDPLMEEALYVRLRDMRQEIAGENPTALEAMLADRVVAGWLLVEVLEALISAQYSRHVASEKRATPTYLLQQSKILESATRRHMQAIQTLARVRKLLANTPGVQFNTQINVRS
jgi:hypothetical protein